MSTVVANLKAARDLIADRARWQRGSMRSEFHGGLACYCAVGAVAQAIDPSLEADHWRHLADSDQPKELHALVAALPPMYTRPHLGPLRQVTSFNDLTSHSEVIGLFDRAIAKLEGKTS
jgi:hypothetical protein